MKVLLTGATGYFGSYLAQDLIRRGHDLHVLIRSVSRLDRIADIVPPARRHALENDTFHTIRELSPDVLIHAATCYDRLGEGIHAVYKANVALPMLLIEAAELAGVPLMVNTDTSLPPEINSYALSKRHFAEWARRIAERGTIRVLNVRLESVYGPGDDDTKFITQLLRALVRNDPEFPLTPGEQARDFIHVKDAAEAYLRLVEHSAQTTESSWIEAGVGSSRAVTIREFAELAGELSGAKTQLQFGAKPYRTNEIMVTKADVQLLWQIGWPGDKGLRAGLKATIEEERRRL